MREEERKKQERSLASIFTEREKDRSLAFYTHRDKVEEYNVRFRNSFLYE